MREPRPYQLGVEHGPAGWLCPAWDQGGTRHAYYRGKVHRWNPKTELFEETGLRPPWETDHRERAMEGL